MKSSNVLIRLLSALVNWANSAKATNDKITRWCLVVLLMWSPFLVLGSLVGGSSEPKQKQATPQPTPIVSPSVSPSPSPVVWETPKTTPPPVQSPSVTPVELPVQKENPISENIQPATPTFDTPIRDSRSGSCECPYDTDRRGRRCGARSAYSRAGGSPGMCYQ